MDARKNRPCPRTELLRSYLLGPLAMKQIAVEMGITWASTRMMARYLYARVGVGDRLELMADEIERLRNLLRRSPVPDEVRQQDADYLKTK